MGAKGEEIGPETKTLSSDPDGRVGNQVKLKLEIDTWKAEKMN